MSSFQNEIIKTYEISGYMVIDLIRTNKNGITDLLALKDGRCIFIEVKEAKDNLKPLQKYRIDQLSKLGFTAFCLQDGKGIIYPPHLVRSLDEFKKLFK